MDVAVDIWCGVSWLSPSVGVDKDAMEDVVVDTECAVVKVFVAKVLL